MVRAELDGDSAPALVAAKTTLELSGKSYAVRFDGEIVDEGTFSAAEAAGYFRMMLGGVTGPNSGRTIPAICQRVHDRLRICYGLDGCLPAGFATRPGSRLYLATYRRVAR